MAAALECGVTWINCAQPCFCQAPWGGVKNSGFGRELGEAGLEAYLALKQVHTLCLLTKHPKQVVSVPGGGARQLTRLILSE